MEGAAPFDGGRFFKRTQMNYELSHVCRVLEESRRLEERFNALIIQYIEGMKSNPVMCAEFIDDPSIARFVSLIFVPVIENPPAQALNLEGIHRDALEFLVSLCWVHPKYRDVIAWGAPLNALMRMYFSAPLTGDEPDALLVFQFFSFVCSSRSSQSAEVTQDAFDKYFGACFRLLETGNTALLPWIFSSMAGFFVNSSVALETVKTYPEFLRLRTNIATHLNVDNQRVMLAALTLLVLLFPTDVLPDTAMSIAINGLCSHSDFQMGQVLSMWIVFETIDHSAITKETIFRLIECSVKQSGNAYWIYHMLAELSESHGLLSEVLGDPDIADKLVEYLIERTDGCVAVAGSKVVMKVGQQIQTSSTTYQKLVCSLVSRATPNEKKLSDVILLRMIVATDCSRALLQKHENEIFFELQRVVELKQAEVALQLFLLLCENVALKSWSRRISEIVTCSQFTVLLTDVLVSSSSKDDVELAMLAMTMIVSGLTVQIQSSPMLNTLLKACQWQTERRKHQEIGHRREISQLEERHRMEIQAIEVERDLAEQEIVAVQREKSAQADVLIDIQQKLEATTSNCETLKNQLQTEKDRNCDLEAENQRLKDRISQLEKNLMDQKSAHDLDISKLREKNLERINAEKQRSSAEIKKLRDDLIKLQGTSRTEKDLLERQKTTIVKLRKQLTARRKIPEKEPASDRVFKSVQTEKVEHQPKKPKRKKVELDDSDDLIPCLEEKRPSVRIFFRGASLRNGIDQ